MIDDEADREATLDPRFRLNRETCGRKERKHGLGSQLARIYPWLYRFCRDRVQSKEEAEDLTQECMLQLVRADMSFRTERELRSYSRGVAWRVAAATRRKALRHARQAPQAFAIPLREPPRSPENLYQHQRCLDEFARLADELPAPQAMALTLQLIHGYSLQEIASVTRTPLGTVRGRLRVAKMRLRQRASVLPMLTEAIHE